MLVTVVMMATADEASTPSPTGLGQLRGGLGYPGMDLK